MMLQPATRYLLLIFSALSISACSPFEEVRIMSFNIRYDNPADGEDAWPNRREEVCDMLYRQAPGIIGLQEVLAHQLEELDSALVYYNYIGVGREDGRLKGEFCPIFYDTLAFQNLAFNTWWLSPTSDTVSVGWDAALERIVTYGAFRDRQHNDTLHVFNTHFDHMGDTARLRSAGLILDLINEIGLMEKKVIVLGDLNAEPDSEPLELLQTILERQVPEHDTGTFNGFDPGATYYPSIDHILTRNLEVKTATILTERRKNDRFLSDHFPVLGVFE